MTKVYVIGNGFDLHHNLHTSFRGFMDFLEYDPVRITFEKYLYCEAGDTYEKMWKNLEKSLSKFDIDVLIEDKRSYYDDDPHNDSFLYEVNSVIENLTTRLVDRLNTYLTIANCSSDESCKSFNFDPSFHFICFNYTNTLERIYKIPKTKICYIHGMLNSDIYPLVVGHGNEHPTFYSEENKPLRNSVIGFSVDEEIEAFKDTYCPVFEESVEAAHSYYERNRKKTEDCIALHQKFLSSLTNITEIIILGHSLGEVDHSYFHLLSEATTKDCLWRVSYYLNDEKETLEKSLRGIVKGKQKIESFRMSDL